MGANERSNMLHALGRVTTSTGAVLVAGTGNWSAANIAAGIADVTLNDPIDTTQRLILLTPKTTSLIAAVITANDTDTVFRISVTNDAAGATDADIDFLVMRIAP